MDYANSNRYLNNILQNKKKRMSQIAKQHNLHSIFIIDDEIQLLSTSVH